MSPRFIAGPENALDLFQQLLNSLPEASKLRRALQGNLSIEYPHPVYVLHPAEVKSGGGVEFARITSIRYLILLDNKCAAAIEFSADLDRAKAVTSVNFGPFVQATIEALEALKEREETAGDNQEVRLLHYPGTYLVSLWLKAENDEKDLFYPLAPTAEGIKPGSLYSGGDFKVALQGLVQKISTSRNPAIHSPPPFPRV